MRSEASGPVILAPAFHHKECVKVNLDKIKPHIASVVAKVESGEYQMEPTVCLCGGADDVTLTTVDRYMIPHTMVMCKDCGLIRANPRMTADAYYRFYNTEYRPLYDGHEWGELGLEASDEFRFMRQGKEGVSFKEFLDYFAVRPHTVVDIGSSFGGLLQAFRERGATVYGVEIDKGPRKFANSVHIPTTMSIDDLITLGVKADLVVLSDVIEHLTDFSILEKIPQIMNEHAHLYVDTPGLFRKDSFELWQNAHVWQFVGGTLEYLMGKYGYEAVFLDETIHSIWTYENRDPAHPFQGPTKSNQWCQYIVEHLRNDPKRTMPPIRGVCKFTQDERVSAVRANLKQGYPDLSVLQDVREKAAPGTALILGGGPSVDEHIEEIRQRQQDGAHVFCIDRMYPWCHAHGIVPDYVVALDGCTDVVDGFAHLEPGVTYLMGTAVQPQAVELLKGQTVYYYNAPMGKWSKIQNDWLGAGYTTVTVISTGSTVVLGAYSLAQILNYPDIHFYGFDLKVPEGGKDYASAIGGVGVPREYFHIEINEKPILTCLSFISFAQQFFKMTEEARKRQSITAITVHGDSMINDMWDGKFVEIPESDSAAVA